MKRKITACTLSALMVCACIQLGSPVWAANAPAPGNLAYHDTNITVSGPTDPNLSLDYKYATPTSYDTPFAGVGILTDGVIGSGSSYSLPSDLTKGTWFRLFRGSYRTITIDLGSIDAINSIALSFGQNEAAGIRAPMFLKYYVSNDGSNYEYLGKCTTPDVPQYVQSTGAMSGNAVDRKVYTMSNLADGSSMNVQGRYVKLVFPVDICCYIDELTVMGTSGPGTAVVPTSQPDTDESSLIVNQYPSKGSAAASGLSDQFLLYTAPVVSQTSTMNPDTCFWTKPKLTQILGYEDKSGNPTDWLFKDILVMPENCFTYTTKDNWQQWLNFIFGKTNPESQLQALDDAAGDLNQKLGTSNTVSVGIGIPICKDFMKSTYFGDVNGDGIYDSMNPLDYANDSRVTSLPGGSFSVDGQKKMFELANANREAAVHWFVDTAIAKFKAGTGTTSSPVPYKNLKLTNFYCYEENAMTSFGEDILIKDMASYVRSKGYSLTWIPNVGRSSAYEWKNLGITSASMQPNFAFNDYKKKRYHRRCKPCQSDRDGD